MKYKLEDNHLIIYYENGDIKEDATENQTECSYCTKNKNSCVSNSPEDTKKYGGQFCDLMKYKYNELEAQ